MSRDFDWPEFVFLLCALRWTIVLSLIAFVGGGVGGLLLALARTSSITRVCAGSPLRTSA